MIQISNTIHLKELLIEVTAKPMVPDFETLKISSTNTCNCFRSTCYMPFWELL